MLQKTIKALLGGAVLALVAGTAAWSADLTIWWNKSYYPEEDQRFTEIVKDWEKQSGKTVDLSFYTNEDAPKKAVAALDAGTPPDLGFGFLYDFDYTPRWAFEGKLEDVSDVIAAVKDDLTDTAVKSVYLLNGKTGKRSYYAMPTQQQTAHIHYWKDLIEEAGFKESDIPSKWEDFWAFWCKAQAELKKKGKRVYGMGQTVSSAASDTTFHFNMFLNAYDVKFMDEDGKLLVDDPKVREGIITAMKDFIAPYQNGCVPPGAVNWQDSDNNVNFLNKITIMTPNPSLSIPASQKNANPDAYANKMRTIGYPDGPSGKPIVYMTSIKTAVIFAQGKNKELAKDFMKFLYKPEHLGPYLQGSLGRWYPVNKSLQKDPYWTETKDPHLQTHHKQYQEHQTVPFQMIYNWKYSQLQAERIWGKAMTRVLLEGASVEDAVDELIARIKQVING
ncbi:MAG: ABC transporter substrate-binding protein [Gammaproteobacteria bacterium]